MSRTRPPRWVQNTLIGLLVICGLGLVIVPQIDIPHPLISNAEDSAAKVMLVERHRRWIVTHSYGALSSRYADMVEVRERADALPEGLRRSFYEGAAHNQCIDFDDLDALLEEVGTHIPNEQQSLFHEAILRLYTREHGENPQRVMDFAREISNKTQAQDLVDGIRVGLQEEFGGNMGEAIQIALQYPTDLYRPLFEELGWRIGNDHGVDAQYWRKHESVLPEETRCWLAEGMTKGALILKIEDNELWWNDIQTFRSSIEADCGAEIASGVAEALLIVLGDNPDTLTRHLDQLGFAEDRLMVEKILAQKQQATSSQSLDALPDADPNLPPT